MPRKYRQYRRFAKPSPCAQCGLVLLGQRAHQPAHKRSLYHRYAATIRQQLEAGATLEEIAQPLNCTRERIRQLASRMGVQSSKATRQARAAERRLTDFLNSLPNTRLGRFLEQCAQRGLSSELVPYKNGSWWRNRAVVNGKNVLVKPASTIRNRFGKSYIRIVGTNHPVDLIAYELPDGRWAFFKPFGTRRNGSGLNNNTMFALHEVRPGDKGYKYNRDHNHRDAIENWTLFTG